MIGCVRGRGGWLVIAVLGAALVAAPASAHAGPGSATTAVVSLGDSYISGEAGRWQGNSVNPSGTRDGTDRAAYNCTAVVCSYDGSRVYGLSARQRLRPLRRRRDQERHDRGRPRRSTSPARAPPPRTSSARARAGRRRRASHRRPISWPATRSASNVKLVVLVDRRQRPRLRGHRAGLRDRVPEPDRGPAARASSRRSTRSSNSAMFNVGQAIDEMRAIMSAAGYQNFRLRAAELSLRVRAGEREPIPREQRRQRERASAGAPPTTRTPTGPATPW